MTPTDTDARFAAARGEQTVATTAERCAEPRTAAAWHRGAVGYQVYVRSFADSSGDGMGDLLGVASRLDHLEWLGVDAVWLTPFFPSPGHDHGYDVSDYCAVAAAHGTIADFDRLVADAHRRGLKVIVDIVPNHTSDEHPWFKQARKGRDAPGRARYLWADPSPDGGPPNNWVSHFGGSAWTLDKASGQYWCHLFLPEQPDLNWRDDEVLEAFDDILRWWIDHGVDGFRVDVAYGLVKHAELLDNPQLRPINARMDPHEAFAAFEHLHDIDQPETPDVYRRWHSLCAPHGVILLGEINLTSSQRMARYVEPGALDGAFFLEPVWMSWSPRRLCRLVRAMHDGVPDGIAWAQSNHDRARAVSRYGGDEVGRARSLAVSTLLMSLGGMPFLYQGEELGLPDGVLRAGGLQDPVSLRNVGAVTGRDVCRTPMAWDASANNGFSAGVPWIDAEPRPESQTVAGQRDDPDAPIHRYRELLALRRACPDLWRAPLQWLTNDHDAVLALRRGDAVVATNLSESAATVGLPDQDWRVAFASRDCSARPDSGRVRVPAETSLILLRAPR